MSLNIPTFIVNFIIIHLFRQLHFRNYVFGRLIFNIGIEIIIILMVVLFIGYILSWGQISYWGATVIINLFAKNIILLISGNYYIYYELLQRYFIIHFIFPFILLILSLIHVYFLHFISSNNLLNFNYYRIILLLVLIKDLIGINLIFFVILLIVNFLILILNHHDNMNAINILVTPLHIIP
jgi:ubiquinol-cytochrome c reductase cytochrome b subunit